MIFYLILPLYHCSDISSQWYSYQNISHRTFTYGNSGKDKPYALSLSSHHNHCFFIPNTFKIFSSWSSYGVVGLISAITVYPSVLTEIQFAQNGIFDMALYSLLTFWCAVFSTQSDYSALCGFTRDSSQCPLFHNQFNGNWVCVTIQISLMTFCLVINFKLNPLPIMKICNNY